MGTDIIVRDAHRHDHRLPLTESPKPTLRQALGDKRIMAVLLMSFASGLPFNLSGSGFAFQAWLASEGVNLKAIGFYSLVGLPYIFKFLWAPLLDRYLPPLLGRRRGWIVVFQAGLAVAIGVMRIVLAFEIKRLPDDVDKAWTSPDRNGTAAGDKSDAGRLTAAAS